MAKKPAQDKLPAVIANSLPAALEAGRLLAKLNEQLIKAHKQMEESTKSGAIATARAFVVMRRLKDRMEETDKAFKAIFASAASKIVPEAFEQEGVQTIPLQEGFRVTTSSRLFASILKDNRKAAIEWLRENGLGDIVNEALIVSALDEKRRKAILAWVKRNNADEMLDAAVNPQTLSAAARHLVEEQAVELPEELFRSEYVHNTSVTATKGKSASVLD